MRKPSQRLEFHENVIQVKGSGTPQLIVEGLAYLTRAIISILHGSSDEFFTSSVALHLCPAIVIVASIRHAVVEEGAIGSG